MGTRRASHQYGHLWQVPSSHPSVLYPIPLHWISWRAGLISWSVTSLAPSNLTVSARNERGSLAPPQRDTLEELVPTKKPLIRVGFSLWRPNNWHGWDLLEPAWIKLSPVVCNFFLSLHSFLEWIIIGSFLHTCKGTFEKMLLTHCSLFMLNKCSSHIVHQEM